MRRREFITLLGGTAAAWPLMARAQQTRPVIGFLRSSTAAAFAHLVAAFREGLKETGFVEGQNVGVEYRWADNHLDRLPALARELVNKHVAAIVGNSLAAEAARQVTAITPIVFVAGDDPVKIGLVKSLNRPGGNLTGVTFFAGGQLGQKRVELLHELVPNASTVGVLSDPSYPGFKSELPDVATAIRSFGLQVAIVEAANERDFEPAFAKVAALGANALLVGGSPVFTGQRRALVALAARYSLPAIYDLREHVEAGGLLSYGASITDAYRQAGVYAGRILRGANPADMPIEQPTKFELVINLKTAKALGLTIPQSVLLRADEVIE